MKRTTLLCGRFSPLAIIALSACVLSSPPARAQEVSVPGTVASAPASPTVPAYQWTYAALNRLKKAGFEGGLPDTGTRPMTRDELARVLARLTDKFPVVLRGVIPTKGYGGSVSRYATRRDAAELRRLADEFRPELEQQGQSIPALNDKLNALFAYLTAIDQAKEKINFSGTLHLMTPELPRTIPDRPQ